MKSIINLSLICTLMILFSTPALAQKSEKEKNKQTKKELKQYIKNPESYRNMIDKHEEELDSYETKVADLEEDYNEANNLQAMYADSIAALNSAIAKAQEAQEAASLASKMYKNEGTDFRVQVGAYKHFDLTQLLQLNQPIGFDKVDGVITYYLGSWETAEEAYDFAQALRKMKMKDAFVSKYVDGQRVAYDYLIEGSKTSMNQ